MNIAEPLEEEKDLHLSKELSSESSQVRFYSEKAFNVKSTKDRTLLNSELSVNPPPTSTTKIFSKNPLKYYTLHPQLIPEPKNLLTRPDTARFLFRKCSSLFFNTADGL